MTYGTLKSRLVAVSHRTDLTASLPDFVEDARIKLNSRFGLTLAPFVADSDTNTVLTNFPLLYLYAALQSLYEHLNNGDNASYYKGLFDEQCSLQNITANSGATDPYYGSPPVVIPGGTTAGGGAASAGAASAGTVPDPLYLNKLVVGSTSEISGSSAPLQVSGRVYSESPGFVYPLGSTPGAGAFLSVGYDGSNSGFASAVFNDLPTINPVVGSYKNTASGGLPLSGTRFGMVGFGWLQSTGGAFNSATITAFAEGNIVQAADHSTSLRFATASTAGAIERMRIKPTGTLALYAVATYADNTAALAGGKVAGDVYRTSTGQLMIVF